MKTSEKPAIDQTEQQTQSYHRIRSLAVTGGFLDGLKLNFDDRLNCIIGGRGTGKTTVLELIRFALDKMPDDFLYEEKRAKIEQLIENNLGNGTVQVVVETQDGQTLSIERQAKGDLVVTDELGLPIEFSPESGILFNAEIYSQDEIEEIAADPLFQLKLIDKFRSQDISEVEAQINSKRKELEKNAAELIRTKADIEIHMKKVVGLPEIVQRLKAFQVSGGDSAQVLQQEISNQAIREKEKAYVEGLESFFQAQQAEVESMANALAPQVSEFFDEGGLAGPNKDLIGRFRKECETAASTAAQKILEGATALEKMAARAAEWRAHLATTVHAPQEKKYRDLLNQHEKEKIRAKDREMLVKKHNELLAGQKLLEKAKKDSDALKANRRTLLENLSNLNDTRYQYRREVVDWLNEHKELKSTIRVSLEQFGNVDRYQKILEESLVNCGFHYNRTVPKAIQILAPEKLAELVERKDFQTLSEKLDLNDEQVQKFVTALHGKESLYALETVELYDRPVIELKDGKEFKNSASISTGQRCSTILPILLLRSENPLLIDQPENNLDNAFIYDPVVQTLRSLKGKRQFIFVTHNPNIPVGGDAEKVFLMYSDGRRGKVKESGNVDALKKNIENILEGGEDAFKERYKRYGH